MEIWEELGIKLKVMEKAAKIKNNRNPYLRIF